MSEAAASGEFEAFLSSALRPVEPPETLTGRFEETMSKISEAAASELSDWADELSTGELEALKDPRNWVRPVVAVAAGSVATGALVVLETRRRARHRRGPGLQQLADSLRERF